MEFQIPEVRNVSSIEPDDRVRAQRQAVWLFAAWIGGLVIFVCSILLTLAVSLFCLASTSDGHVISQEAFQDRHRGGLTAHYYLTLDYKGPAGEDLESRFSVPGDAYGQIKVGKVLTVHYFSPWPDLAQLSDENGRWLTSFSVSYLVLALFLSCAVLMALKLRFESLDSVQEYRIPPSK
jgi:hypothetical protein